MARRVQLPLTPPERAVAELLTLPGDGLVIDRRREVERQCASEHSSKEAGLKILSDPGYAALPSPRCTQRAIGIPNGPPSSAQGLCSLYAASALPIAGVGLGDSAMCNHCFLGLGAHPGWPSSTDLSAGGLFSTYFRMLR